MGEGDGFGGVGLDDEVGAVGFCDLGGEVPAVFAPGVDGIEEAFFVLGLREFEAAEVAEEAVGAPGEGDPGAVVGVGGLGDQARGHAQGAGVGDAAGEADAFIEQTDFDAAHQGVLALGEGAVEHEEEPHEGSLCP